MAMANIDLELISQFQEDGAVLLKNAFEPKWIALAEKVIQKTMDNPSEFSEMLKPNENEGGYFNDYCNWQQIPELIDFVHHSPAAQIVGQLMKSKIRYASYVPKVKFVKMIAVLRCLTFK